MSSTTWDVDCEQHADRWAATVRGSGLPASTGHRDPVALVFAAVDLVLARTGLHPARVRLHPAPGSAFGAWFPHGRSEHRTRTVGGRDWSDTWTATPDPDVPDAVLVSTRSTAVPGPTTSDEPVPAPRRAARTSDLTP